MPPGRHPGSGAGAARRPRIAVFASGNGSNFQALVEAERAGLLDGHIGLLVCDKPQARVIERAARLDVPVFSFRPRDYASREDYEAEIVSRLREHQIDLIVLAGYMRIVTPVLLEAYPERIVNIHPSLLPAFPGLHAVRQALEHGVKVTGATVHFVDGGMDTGPIIAQRAVEVLEDDTEETLADRIHAIEHELYREAVQLICEGRVRVVDGKRVEIDRTARR
ncbi:phosphoribosylglycinamide formyltransferase [Paenibacillus thermoaerophilus]|uniref:Phosphoribosylglycinamide formyltransferase n=1 Tax=Paenibacillus thermoaerophilus TaxID=1215385 RepID=A0ABW2V4M4_9BACL|nr:phosphoribosylglycinamide formyltransferase [Paenibacillus thermoaerophilus]TMV13950.1 phosphoribosylglycinamide formyltransferase [Paenibacillus thermoaerophilus]